MPKGQALIRWDAENTSKLFEACVYYGLINTAEADLQRVADHIQPGLPAKTVRDQLHRVKGRMNKQLGQLPQGGRPSPARPAKRAIDSGESGPAKRAKVKAEEADSDDEGDMGLSLSQSRPKSQKQADQDDEKGAAKPLAAAVPSRRTSLRQSPKKDYDALNDPFKEWIRSASASRFAVHDDNEDTENEYKPPTRSGLGTEEEADDAYA